jgi:purine-binding chemotaxis protein CheW
MDASTHIVVFYLDGSGYGLRLDRVARVVQSVECMPLHGAPGIVAGVIDLHGQMLPVLNIRERFGFAAREIGVEDHFVIASAFGRAVAIVVDRVDGVIERSAGSYTGRPDRVSPSKGRIEGVALVEDGVTLILDLDQCLSEAEQQMLDRALAEHSETEK